MNRHEEKGWLEFVSKKFSKVLCYLLTCSILTLMLPYQVDAMECSSQIFDTSRFEIVGRTSEGVIYDSEEARPVVPQNAIINEVYRSNNTGIVYIDYTVNTIRYIDEYLLDGTVRSNSLSGNVLTTRVGNEITNSVINSTSYSFSMSEETIANIKEAVLNNGNLDDVEGIQISKYNGKTIIEPENMNTDASVLRSVGIYSQTDSYTEVTYPMDANFQPYNAREVANNMRYISALGSSREVKVYETQDYYTTVNADYVPIAIGATITGISLAVAWPTSVIQAVLAATNVLMVGEQLAENIFFYTNKEIEYWFAVEGGVYDTTEENDFVQVNVEAEWGTFTYGLNSSNQVQWIRVYNDIPDALKYQIAGNYTPIIDNAVEIYNNNIEAEGYWRWGKGVFGG